MLSDISSALTIIILTAIIIWFIVLVISLITLLKRSDLLFPVKIFWAAVIFFAPVVGLLIYLMAGPKRKRISRYNTATNKLK